MAAIVGRQGTAQVFITDGADATLALADKLTHLTTFTPPTAEPTEIDVTDFDSTGKEYEYGTVDYGELQATQHLTDDEYNDMMTRVTSQTACTMAYFIVKKDGSTLAVGRKGNCYVKSCTLEGVEVDGAITVQTTFKITGATSTATLPSA